jgi:hypothetical protein
LKLRKVSLSDQPGKVTPAKDSPAKTGASSRLRRFCLWAPSMSVVLEVKVLNGCSPSHTSIALAYLVSHDLNFSNRPVRPRMPGGMAGARPIIVDPYADFLDLQLF